MKERNIGLDVFRVLSMLFVVVLHVLGHGGAGGGDWMSKLLEIICYPGVNCFVLLSGYLLSQKRFSLARIISLWFTVLFWTVTIQLLSFLAGPEFFGWGRLAFAFLPVLSGKYWFFNAYLAMTLFAPLLNRLIHSKDSRGLKIALLASLTIFCFAPLLAGGSDVFGTAKGYHFSWFLVLYLLGGYLRQRLDRADETERARLRKNSGICCLCLIAAHWLWRLLWSKLGAGTPVENIFLSYTSPLILGEAVCLLILFAAAKKGCCQGFVGGALELAGNSAFSVYLIHDHPLVREYLIQGRFSWLAGQFPLWTGLGAIIIAVGIFAACILLDQLRLTLFRIAKVDMLAQKLGKFAGEKVKTFLN